MIKTLTLFTFIVSTNSYSSSIDTCEYSLKIENKTKTALSFNVVKLISKNKGCLKHVKKNVIKTSKVTMGIDKALIGKEINAKRESYSGRGPNGLVTSSSWIFK